MADTHTDWLTASSEHPQAKNDIRIQEDRAYVSVGHDLEAIVDVSAVPLIARHRWHVDWNEWGVPYVRSNTAGRIHRLITHAPDGMVVDHINHNTLDNRRENLRVVTHKQNHQNRKGANKNNRLGFRGVGTWRAPDGRCRYQARVYVDGKCHVRYFPYTEDGLEAAVKAAAEMRATLMPHSMEARTNG